MNDTLKIALRNLPNSSGVYRYLNKNHKLLYVGKAKNLKLRVKSYFRFKPIFSPAKDLSARIVKMLDETQYLETIVCDNELDALVLENSLIKQLKPKYNILLRDDKTYPYIVFDKTANFGRFEITRKVQKSKNYEYFGPFSTGAKEILEALYEHFALVQKRNCLDSKKPCIFYQIQKCLAPCVKFVGTQKYTLIVNEAKRSLQNRQLLIDKNETKMRFLAENLRFEEAMKLRDANARIKQGLVKVSMDLASDEMADIFAVDFNDQKLVVMKLFLRDGKVISSDHEVLGLKNGASLNELYKSAIFEFYVKNSPVKAIWVADDFEEKESLQELLSQKYGYRINILKPKIGIKASIVKMAKRNAQTLLNEQLLSNDILKPLQNLFRLEDEPYFIEVIDNSHLRGQASVGGLVALRDGEFYKPHYRHYHLEARDEYHQMQQTLQKRFESFIKVPPPDLLILDGGAALLKLALEMVQSFGVNLDVVAISKEKKDAKTRRARGKAQDILHTSFGQINLLPSDKRLQFVQKCRDEAHRFTISFHKKVRDRENKTIDLLKLKGISEAKIKKLLQHLGSFEGIKNADEQALKEILSLKDAQNLRTFYKEQQD